MLVKAMKALDLLLSWTTDRLGGWFFGVVLLPSRFHNAFFIEALIGVPADIQVLSRLFIVRSCALSLLVSSSSCIVIQ